MKVIQVKQADATQINGDIFVDAGDWVVVHESFPGDTCVAMNHKHGVRVRPSWSDVDGEVEAIAWGETRAEAEAEARHAV